MVNTLYGILTNTLPVVNASLTTASPIVSSATISGSISYLWGSLRSIDETSTVTAWDSVPPPLPTEPCIASLEPVITKWTQYTDLPDAGTVFVSIDSNRGTVTSTVCDPNIIDRANNGVAQPKSGYGYGGEGYSFEDCRFVAVYPVPSERNTCRTATATFTGQATTTTSVDVGPSLTLAWGDPTLPSIQVYYSIPDTLIYTDQVAVDTIPVSTIETTTLATEQVTLPSILAYFNGERNVSQAIASCSSTAYSGTIITLVAPNFKTTTITAESDVFVTGSYLPANTSSAPSDTADAPIKRTDSISRMNAKRQETDITPLPTDIADDTETCTIRFPEAPNTLVEVRGQSILQATPGSPRSSAPLITATGTTLQPGNGDRRMGPDQPAPSPPSPVQGTSQQGPGTPSLPTGMGVQSPDASPSPTQSSRPYWPPDGPLTGPFTNIPRVTPVPGLVLDSTVTIPADSATSIGTRVISFQTSDSSPVVVVDSTTVPLGSLTSIITELRTLQPSLVTYLSSLPVPTPGQRVTIAPGVVVTAPSDVGEGLPPPGRTPSNARESQAVSSAARRLGSLISEGLNGGGGSTEGAPRQTQTTALGGGGGAGGLGRNGTVPFLGAASAIDLGLASSRLVIAALVVVAFGL